MNGVGMLDRISTESALNVDSPLLSIFRRKLDRRRGSWLAVTYQQSFRSQPTRPLLRLRDGGDGLIDFILPAAAFGTQEWIGLAPLPFADIELLIADANPGDFRVTELVELGLVELQRRLWRRAPSHVLRFWTWDLPRALSRQPRTIFPLPDRYPLKKIASFALKRSRPIEIAGFDKTPADIGQASVVEFLIDATDTRSPEKLVRTIRSLRAQPELAWCATIAVPASSTASILSIVGSNLSDTKFRIVELGADPSQTAALCTMIASARGHWIGFLDPGDCLALETIVAILPHLTSSRPPPMMYSDSAMHDAQGRSVAPQLKPDWSPEYFRNMDYVGRLWLFEREIAKSVAGLHLSDRGDFIYSLATAIADRVNPHEVVHIKRLLLTGERAVPPRSKAGLELRSSSPAPIASIIIPTRDRVDLLRHAIETLCGTTSYGNYEIIVIDNGSYEPETATYLGNLRAQGLAKIVSDRGNFNFPRLVNVAASQATGDVFVLLNNDTTIVEPSWLAELVGLAMKPGVGAVGAKLLYPNGAIQHAGVVLGLGGRAGHMFRGRPGDFMDHLGRLRVVHEVSAVTAACLAVSRKNFEAVGGFDESFAVDFNDVDFCLRLRRAGLRNLWTPHATVVHVESASRLGRIGRRSAQFRAEAAKFTARWQAELLNDPYFHPALALGASGEMLE